MTCIDCENKPAEKNRRICRACRRRRFAVRHPFKYAFENLKSNAKRRGKAFTITFTEFCKFAVKSTYIVGRGKEKNSLHIDRIDESKGYVSGNLQVLTNSDNVKKYLEYSWESKRAAVRKELKLNENDYPF